MIRTARRRLRTALIALCALLLTQWSLAAHACPQLRPAQPHGEDAGIAVALAAGDAAAGADHGCHHGSADARADADDCADAGFDRTLCQKHCEDESQTSSPAPLAAIDAPATGPLRIGVAPAHLPPPAAGAPDRGDATAPPFTILYCVFLS